MLRVVAVAALTLCACRSGNVADYDELYFQWDGSRVICALSIDRGQGVQVSDVEDGLERVQEEDSVLVLYGHDPRGDGGHSVRDLDGVLGAIEDAGLPFLTFRELVGTERRAGVVVTFDDAYIDGWHAERDTFTSYGAVATFFVTRFDEANDTRVNKLRELESDGHEIASHGLNHLIAGDYVADYGVDAYIDDEVVPSLEAMRGAGFQPETYAYPLGNRTKDIDAAVLEHVNLVRTTSYVADTLLVSDPCPE
ncbi:MAG: polysaccharide deacetylase family protein [Deltaproteobacteria bacterium]|jgi:hypothetical protein|nr:polysaccharide deacetylase family protein [Deltaproteobacteria bacterium]